MEVAHAVQRAFKVLADSTRLRLLAALAHGEFAVQELTEALNLPQPRVSRHLGILRDAGVVRDRREGSYVVYRLAGSPPPEWRECWGIAEGALANDPQATRDRAGLDRVLGDRASRSRSFFDSVGAGWDGLRKVLNDDLLRSRAVSRLVSDGLCVADIGTGTGVLAEELANLGVRVVAVDHSLAMLRAARAKLTPETLGNIEFRHGEAEALPIEDDKVDGAFAHMVLHYLPRPVDAVVEMARVTKPGGRVVAVDFVAHEQEWMREELRVLWLGFEPASLVAMFKKAGLVDVRTEIQAPRSPGAELPGTVMATARAPSGGAIR